MCQVILGIDSRYKNLSWGLFVAIARFGLGELFDSQTALDTPAISSSACTWGRISWLISYSIDILVFLWAIWLPSSLAGYLINVKKSRFSLVLLLQSSYIELWGKEWYIKYFVNYLKSQIGGCRIVFRNENAGDIFLKKIPRYCLSASPAARVKVVVASFMQPTAE